MNFFNSFLLTSLAGFSTLLGMLIIFFPKKDGKKIITASLGFAAGIMITVSLSDLLPEGFSLLKISRAEIPSFLIVLIFTVLGILISMTIDKYLPDSEKHYKDGILYRIGIISMLSIIIHNIPEGIATFITSASDLSLGITLTTAIALHNIPEGISIAVPIYYATGSKIKAFYYVLLSALSEPFGAIIAYLFLKPYMNHTIMGAIYAMIAGLMLYISFYELLPTSFRYQKKKITYSFFILGCMIMLLSHFLFG